MMFPLVHGVLAGIAKRLKVTRYFSIIKEMNPWAYWPLNEQMPSHLDPMIDSSGYDRHGTYTDISGLPGAYESIPSNGDSPVAIPSNSSAVSQAIVTADLLLDLVFVAVFIEHEDLSELKVEVSNGFDSVVLLDFGDASGTSLDMQWANRADPGVPPTVIVNPELSIFEGISSQQTWTLTVTNSGSSASGLFGWAIMCAGNGDPTVAGIPLDRNTLVNPILLEPELVEVVSNLSLSIPDNSSVGVSDTASVAESFEVGAIHISVDISHTYIGDLELTLSNDQRSVVFRSDEGGSADDLVASFGSNDGLGADYVVEALSQFVGDSSAGDWTLKVVDLYGGDTGTLNAWTLTVLGEAVAEGNIGKLFSGDRFVPVVSDGDFKLGSDSLPVKELEAWVTFHDATNDQLVWREGDEQYGWAMGVHGGRVKIGAATAGQLVDASYPISSLTLGYPYHVCGVIDRPNDVVKLFISNTLVSEVSGQGLGGHSSAIGAVLGSGYDAFDTEMHHNPLSGGNSDCWLRARVDQVAIYDRERSAAERELAYLAGDLGITPPLPTESGWVDLLPGYRRLHLAGAGSGIALLVNDSGEVSDWGWNSESISEPAGIGPVAQVSAYDYTYWAVTDSGAIHTWGNSLYIDIPLPNDLSSGYKAVSAGEGHVMFLREDGTIVCSGDNGANQCDVPVGLSNVGVISAGGYFSAGIKNTGEVFVFGDSNDPRIQPPAGLVAVDISTRSYAIIAALSIEGDVVVWGNTDYGFDAMLNVPAIEGEVASIATTISTVGVLKTDGTVQIWGEDYNGETSPPEGLDRVIQLVGGDYYYLALRYDGSIVVIGSPGPHMNVPSGLLGDTELDDPFVPVEGPKSLTDAQLAYHFPFYGDGQNRGVLGASVYDLASPNISLAYDYRNQTYSGPVSYPPVLFGNALTVGDFPLSSVMGDGLNYTVILGFRVWDTDDDNPSSFGDLLNLTVNGVSVLRVSNEENIGTNNEEIFVHHRNQGGGSMDSAMISDYGRSFWRTLVITRQEDVLTASIIGGHSNTVTIPMSSSSSPIHGLGPAESAILSLGASGMVISGLGIFDYALTAQEVGDVIDPFADTGFSQFTSPPQ